MAIAKTPTPFRGHCTYLAAMHAEEIHQVTQKSSLTAQSQEIKLKRRFLILRMYDVLGTTQWGLLL
jgi:hypothetical protein